MVQPRPPKKVFWSFKGEGFGVCIGLIPRVDVFMLFFRSLATSCVVNVRLWNVCVSFSRLKAVDDLLSITFISMIVNFTRESLRESLQKQTAYFDVSRTINFKNWSWKKRFFSCTQTSVWTWFYFRCRLIILFLFDHKMLCKRCRALSNKKKQLKHKWVSKRRFKSL